MTAVRRFNKGSGGGTPKAPVRLLTPRWQAPGLPDFWDRHDGNFGPLDRLNALTAEERQRANSLYRLGSKALLRNELSSAVSLLGEAAASGHPGALFRLALAALRAGGSWAEEAWFLIAEAARHGHGDARQLLTTCAGHGAADAANTFSDVEDDVFLNEICEHLGELPPRHGPVVPSSARTLPAPDEGPDPALDGAEQLVLVPAPALPQLSSTVTDGDGTGNTNRGTLHALSGCPTLQVPDFGETPTDGRGAVLPEEEPWWSANALRPAVLTGMARSASAPAVIPAQWQATQRARDLLVLVHQSSGIDTRSLARRTRVSMHIAVRLLDWLREQRFIETIRGTHFPGPLMALATGPGPHQALLTDALAELRDALGAAVYVSSYTDGEIVVQQSSSSASAPAVSERAPFGATGHASAVGKSLLAQLTFPARMDHLSRYPYVQLTDRTITNTHTLFERLDGHGPHSAQFDLLEYSNSALCVAFSLGLPGRASSIAISLPSVAHERLINTAEALSRRATGLLLVHLLTDDLQHNSGAVCAADEGWSVPQRALL
ncbi:IclR family transcriptional regulator C-terminal domain-containing protein [Streptomyces sp. NPDC102473]|uniref:IclR family transcriptional regulator domain-containing protein n=1 Tax=Streptomyces sp. NPDC102473 TaxID=3366180 RepID=UPI00382619AE